MADIADILGRVAAAEAAVSICVDGTIAGQLEDLERRWLAATQYDQDHNSAPTAPAVADQIEMLREAATAATVEFRVRAIGATAWRRLVADYPPPVDDTEGWRWNPDLFPQAAVAACCIDPVMTEGQAQELADRLSEGAWTKLFSTTLNVNLTDAVPKFEIGIGGAPTTELRSTTAPLEESLTASSSA